MSRAACGKRLAVLPAFFDLDGNVISGPPRRPLDEYRARVIDGRVELYVPADFATPVRPADG